MRFFVILMCISCCLLGTIKTWASPFMLVNGGSTGSNDNSSIGVETGGTRAIMNLLPLSAEVSLKSTVDSIPPDTNVNSNKLHEPYATKKLKDGPEIGYLLKSGVNLNQNIPNLTLQVGGGYALQRVVNVATSIASGTHWQQVSKGTEVLPLGYVGLLYRLNSICISAGYNVQRGLVLGVGKSW